MAMQPGTSPVEKVPAEVWLEIIKHVPDSRDLRSLNVASWKFCNLTTRALHRDVVWAKDGHAAQDLDVWKTDANMARHVSSLVLGIGGVPSNNTPEENAAILDNYAWPSMLNGRTPAEQQALLDSGLMFLFTPRQVQVALWARVQTFTNLSSLFLKNMSISNAHFGFIHSLPQLRSLRLMSCMVGAISANGFDNRVLPINELTIGSLRRARGAVPQDPLLTPVQAAQLPVQPVMVHVPMLMMIHQLQQPPIIHDPFAQALTLAIAANLRTLTIDLSTDLFRHVFSAPGAQVRGWVIPPMLEHLYIRQERTITARVRKDWDDADESHCDASLYEFCSRAQNLKTISTPAFEPRRRTMDLAKLPPSLEAFAAPLDTAQIIASHCNVKALGVLKCRLDTREALEALALIAHARPGLEVLVFEVKTWDAEIVSAIAQHFKNLRRLKIVYGNGGPDENYLVNLGANCLDQMPELRTFEMYKLPPKGSFAPEHPIYLFDSTWGSIEEEMRDILIPWNYWCPKLGKVQLVSGYAMKRGFEGAVWKMEKVARLSRVEYLTLSCCMH